MTSRRWLSAGDMAADSLAAGNVEDSGCKVADDGWTMDGPSAEARDPKLEAALDQLDPTVLERVVDHRLVLLHRD